MSQADELLDSLAEPEVATYSVNSDTEPHIVINADRTVTIPEELKRILVQYDHNIETVTFDCPRYWDGHDLSQMGLRIVFERSDGHKEPHPVENLRINESDNSVIHFDWTISGNTTFASGNVKITVCAKLTNAEGVSEREWHTIPNQDLFVNEGMDCSGDEIVERNPDVIEYILARLDTLESTGGGTTPGSGENQPYELPIGGEELGGVKNGGNVVINDDGTMTAPDNAPTDEQVGTAVGDWLEAHPEATTVVADDSITPAKTTFIEPVVQNLIDISKMVKGGIAEATGEIGTTAGYTSDYIPVEPGKTYRCNVGFGTGGNWASYYYDKDRQKLSIIEGNPFTAPEGAAYVRLSWYFNDDPATKKYALFEGTNLWPFTQGIQRYELDEMLTGAVERVVDRYAAVKAVPKNLYRQAGYGNVNSTTGVIDCGDAGPLRVSDYIELTPGVWYITNCLSAPNFSACYDANKKYVAAFADATERIDVGGYTAFRITDPNVRYIVNGCERSISKPISEPFFCRGSTVPETFDGYDVAVPQADVIPVLKNLLGITGNELAGLTWAVLGDSTTAGSGNTQTYHSIIAAELGITAINHGYNGSWVSYTAAMDGIEMCTRYAEMTDDADIITVMGGVNDINNGATLGEMGDTEKTTFYGALDILCRGLHQKYPGKRIGYITPMNYGDDTEAEPYLEAIHKVCGRYAIPVLDMYHEGLACATTEELSAIYTRDGLHQSDFGHAVQARKVKAFLQRL